MPPSNRSRTATKVISPVSKRKPAPPVTGAGTSTLPARCAIATTASTSSTSASVRRAQWEGIPNEERPAAAVPVPRDRRASPRPERAARRKTRGRARSRAARRSAGCGTGGGSSRTRARAARPGAGQIYEEWRASNHAYAGISPMFHKFEQKVTELAPTIGTFCVRCHMGVGTALNEPREAPLWSRLQVSREGVTCISCHRVSTAYGKVNGERRINPGDIYQPVYGPLGGDGVAEAVKNRTRHRVATSPAEGARAMP